MRFQLLPVSNMLQLPLLFHGLVPGQLPLGMCPCLLGRVPARQGIIWGYVAGNLRGYHQAHISFAKLRKGYGPVATIWLVGQALLSGIDLFEGAGDVPVPLEGIHAQVQVCVDSKHARRLGG